MLDFHFALDGIYDADHPGRGAINALRAWADASWFVYTRKTKTYLRTSSYSGHCLCCRGFGGAGSSRGPLVAVEAVGDPEFAECKATGAAEVLEGLGVGAMDNGPVQDFAKAPTGGAIRDGAGVDVVDGLHQA
jgi:hypothetical protein